MHDENKCENMEELIHGNACKTMTKLPTTVSSL